MSDVREVVRERYGRIAAEAPAGGCCGEGSSCGSTGSLDIGYSEKELSQIPEGANLGLGCGNPLGIAALSAGETVLDLGSGGGIDCFLAAHARTFLAIDRTEGGVRIAGYFTLATASVERRSVSATEALDRLPQFPIPAVLLARLAVDDRAQGQGLGRFLFEEALGLTIELTRTGPVAFRLFVTDAIDGAAVRFFERFGFVRLADGYPCRMVLDLKPLVGG